MKIKWTTITEDESTWPGTNVFFIVEHLPMDRREYGCSGPAKMFDKKKIQFANNLVRKIEDFFGICRWRPMPKPPKKKDKHWTDRLEELSKCSNCGSKEGLMGVLSVLDNKCSECRTSKSPWKSIECFKYEIGKKFLLKNDKMMCCLIPCMGGFNPVLNNSEKWDEWMEIVRCLMN